MDMQINSIAAASAGLTYTAPQQAGGTSQLSGTEIAPSNPNQAAVNAAGNVADAVEINNPALEKQTANNILKAGNNENPTGSKGVVVSYDQLASTEVIKFMDIKGNVVAQIPPRMYLKMMEATGGSMEEIMGGGTTGKLLDEIV